MLSKMLSIDKTILDVLCYEFEFIKYFKFVIDTFCSILYDDGQNIREINSYQIFKKNSFL